MFQLTSRDMVRAVFSAFAYPKWKTKSAHEIFYQQYTDALGNC